MAWAELGDGGALPVLPVIRGLGGCGGTLVARLFGALPRTVVLSETNPRSACLFGGHLNPLAQLRKWRPELLEDVADFDDAEIGYPPRFGDMLEGVWAAAARYGYQLIVRDFSYVDFLGVPFIWPPVADSSLDSAAAGRFLVRNVVLVRNPADQLASLRTHRSLAATLTAERYVEGYTRFLQNYSSSVLFRYEDLAAQPAAIFEQMCGTLGVTFMPHALTVFAEATNVTGNLARAAEPQIAAAARSPEALQAQAELYKLPNYQQLATALGY